MNAKKWFTWIMIMTLSALFLIAGIVFFVDPFFHYRAPNPHLFYKLYDQRSQNDGITKNFDYDAIITGTSMSENFRASQFEEGLGCKTIKVVYSGATYKEINDNLKVSYKSGHSPKYVFRPLDYSLLVKDKDELREDMGEYPEWLTNGNPFDDVKYLLNKDVLLRYALPAFSPYFTGVEPGYTSFDDYSFTDADNNYGKQYVLVDKKKFGKADEADCRKASEEDIEKLKGNIEQNVVSIAREHPETEFICFFPPYSMVYWGELTELGELDRLLTFKEQAINQMLECDNIHIYSFTTHTEITTDLSRYRDQAHYNAEVNSYILDQIINNEKGYENSNPGAVSDRITKENVSDYLSAEKELLKNFDYNSLID